MADEVFGIKLVDADRGERHGGGGEGRRLVLNSFNCFHAFIFIESPLKDNFLPIDTGRNLTLLL